MKLGKVFALKRLKLENEKEGFPITSLREIDMLLKAKHPNVVGVRVSLPLYHTHTHSLNIPYPSSSPCGCLIVGNSVGKEHGSYLHCV